MQADFRRSIGEPMSKRIIVGISGASGVVYGARLLEALKDTDYETHLIISESGKLNFQIETPFKPAIGRTAIERFTV